MLPVRSARFALLACLVLAGMPIASGCPSTGTQGQRSSTGVGNKTQRVVALVGTEPVYEVEVDRMVNEELKRMRNAESIFTKASPREIGFMRRDALHGLLLNAVYLQPGVTFNKTRAIEITKRVSLDKAREVHTALVNGTPPEEVLATLIDIDHQKPEQVNLTYDTSTTESRNAAYKSELEATPVGGISKIVEDPYGYYVLRILDSKPVNGGAIVQHQAFFVPFNKQLGKRSVKEEDLANSKVEIVDATLGALTHLDEALGETDAAKKQAKLAEAMTSLKKADNATKNLPFTIFLGGWILEEQSADPTSGATLEQALAAYQEAAKKQDQVEPGDPALGFYYLYAGSVQERLGDHAGASETLHTALAKAPDNFDLTYLLAAEFEKENDTAYLDKAKTEMARMESTSNYGLAARLQQKKRVPGVAAEGMNGMEEVFDVTGVPQVIE
ncbi:MAG: hypothetical protein ABI743_12325 [bacterium]